MGFDVGGGDGRVFFSDSGLVLLVAAVVIVADVFWSIFIDFILIVVFLVFLVVVVL